MIITVVCDVLGRENNGTTIAAMNLVRSLNAKGHTVRVVCPDADKAGMDGYFIVPTMSFGIFDNYVAKNGVSIAKADDGILTDALQSADVVHIMTPFFLGRRAAYLARKAGIPVSAGFHAMAENLTTHLFLKNFGLANRIAYRYYSGLYRQCSAIHYPTQFLRDLYEAMYGPTNGYVISNGVNEIFRPTAVEKPAQWADKYIILFTGRYSREKNHTVLITAAAESRHRDKLQLVFAGNGPQKEALEKYARKLPIAPIFSFFSRAQMVELLNYADLYVHPAEIEAEGIACLEAISCGLVPVISDSPRCATKAYAIDERNLFHYNKPADLAAKIDWWIEHPEEKRQRSQEYISYAKNRFEQSACMDGMERMLCETAALVDAKALSCGK